jgi:hypothetical protein
MRRFAKAQSRSEGDRRLAQNEALRLCDQQKARPGEITPGLPSAGSGQRKVRSFETLRVFDSGDGKIVCYFRVGGPCSSKTARHKNAHGGKCTAL